MGFWNGPAWRTRSKACAFFDKETEESSPSFKTSRRPVMMSHMTQVSPAVHCLLPGASMWKDTKWQSVCLSECSLPLCVRG